MPTISQQQSSKLYGKFGDLEVWPGKPYPLGATYSSAGVNFALYSEHGSGVELCLFHPEKPDREIHRIKMVEQTDLVWHCFVPRLSAGWLYGYRVEGEWNPRAGLLYNSAKLLVDPYAKAITGMVEWRDELYPYPIDSEHDERNLVKDESDSAPYVCKGVVMDTHFDWGNDFRPETPMHQTIIYEAHVKGMTKLAETLPEKFRGTYAGLGHPTTIEYFQRLGITAVELMPVHHFIQDDFLVKKGLRNYWGYNSLGYFAPHADYCSAGSLGEQVTEFKEMVKNLHAAGIEVILDVVYNHTAEGNHFGPMLSMKGIDNQSYYRLVEDDPQFYMDYTGTGNTLNMVNPRSLQLVMDSLRYWVTEMHVDGFRFDLAAALARGLYEVGRLSTFLDTIHQDPVISQVKLIAEPWDIGPGGYQVGNFPVLWSEWNGKYRDNVRAFWRGDEVGVAELAYRLSGSSDLYEYSGRSPSASINFVTAHDGFTLRDLVSYNEKHNLANGEHNRDGEDHNLSFNFGHEGPTDDPEINAVRSRMQRNFLSTLFLSQGVPMLLMGDEYGRTQHGNNNAYAQDNEITWQKWVWTEEEQQLFDFTRKLIETRMSNPVFHRRRFFCGRAIHGEGIGDILWIGADGREMTDGTWQKGYQRSLGMLLNGQAMDEYDERGRKISDDIFLLLINSHWESVDFVLPGIKQMSAWETVLDTLEFDTPPGEVLAENEYILGPRSLALLRLRTRADNRLEGGGAKMSLLEQLRRRFAGSQE
ncbi:MAG: glycogen debranching protein GlgX [Bacteroidota bacterium]